MLARAALVRAMVLEERWTGIFAALSLAALGEAAALRQALAGGNPVVAANAAKAIEMIGSKSTCRNLEFANDAGFERTGKELGVPIGR